MIISDYSLSVQNLNKNCTNTCTVICTIMVAITRILCTNSVQHVIALFSFDKCESLELPPPKCILHFSQLASYLGVATPNRLRCATKT